MLKYSHRFNEANSGENLRKITVFYSRVNGSPTMYLGSPEFKSFFVV
jgi:hypothetical protein